MKSNGLWKQQWKFEVSASSVKAAAQQHALPSYGELDARVLDPDITLQHHCLLEQRKTNNLWHLKD